MVAEARHGCEKHSPDFQPGRSGMQRGEGARLGVEDMLFEEGVSALDFDASTGKAPQQFDAEMLSSAYLPRGA